MMTFSSIAVRELPIFPLPDVVLFPGRPLPLHIFEFRYRIMMNTILESDRRFGIVMWDPQTGRPATVGCCAEVRRYERLPDDRMLIDSLGQQRFRILDYVREKPYRVGLVEWIEDEPTSIDLRPLAKEVRQLLEDVVRLSAKLTEQPMELPPDVPTAALELSYWIASNFRGVAQEQQRLLELQSTYDRLLREAEILTTTRNHLAARTVLKETFK
ncbi:MAG TPA: LON peptidase substrate-binding domain-containing protein [Thermosynechococcus sp. M98_K2018_005]|uniref:LON peptidase substrate-binding domain-containing protein n=2 Tax=unclassified Thermosynechococcus TaxID=2622553 RepID=UPI0019FE608D|nr:LON peptidase substrate-binding domain-containing protein [Thermosynechococcus sp. M98_K2018_005]HIK48613.1 LON peptidase substrate-binding domain-containing protein [Thermosynechococcus sp. M55_K2018_012]